MPWEELAKIYPPIRLASPPPKDDENEYVPEPAQLNETLLE